MSIYNTQMVLDAARNYTEWKTNRPNYPLISAFTHIHQAFEAGVAWELGRIHAEHHQKVGQLQQQLEAMQRKLAGETLRADQGWQRAQTLANTLRTTERQLVSSKNEFRQQLEELLDKVTGVIVEKQLPAWVEELSTLPEHTKRLLNHDERVAVQGAISFYQALLEII